MEKKSSVFDEVVADAAKKGMKILIVGADDIARVKLKDHFKREMREMKDMDITFIDEKSYEDIRNLENMKYRARVPTGTMEEAERGAACLEEVYTQQSKGKGGRHLDDIFSQLLPRELDKGFQLTLYSMDGKRGKKVWKDEKVPHLKRGDRRTYPVK